MSASGCQERLLVEGLPWLGDDDLNHTVNRTRSTTAFRCTGPPRPFVDRELFSKSGSTASRSPALPPMWRMSSTETKSFYLTTDLCIQFPVAYLRLRHYPESHPASIAATPTNSLSA